MRKDIVAVGLGNLCVRRRAEYNLQAFVNTAVNLRIPQIWKPVEPLSLDLVCSEFEFLLRYKHVGFGGLGTRNIELYVRVNSNRFSRGDERLCRTQTVPEEKQKYKTQADG